MSNWKLFYSLILLLLFVISIGTFLYLNRMETIGPEVSISSCGTEGLFNRFSNYNDSINLDVGKLLFKENCATCHAKNMQDDMTGPALGGSIARFNNDTLQFAEYLIDQEKYLMSAKNERITQLHNVFGLNAKPKFENFDMNEIKSIIEYIEVKYY